jgi:protein-S-isoprenylcysteine O-methyltransferase Ste14
MTSSQDTPERTIGQLVADATNDLSSIMRNEIALAKVEVLADAKAAGTGVGLFAAAAFVALMGLVFLFHTLANVIAIWLPLWAGYAITTALLFVAAVILALVGRRTVERVKGKPERAIKNAQETVDTLKSGI